MLTDGVGGSVGVGLVCWAEECELFFLAGEGENKKTVPGCPDHPHRRRAHSREAPTQPVTLVKTVCQMERGRSHTSSNQTRRGGVKNNPHAPANHDHEQQTTDSLERTTNEHALRLGGSQDGVSVYRLHFSRARGRRSYDVIGLSTIFTWDQL